MSLSNTASSYGAITRSFHWLTALLILIAFPLGLIGSNIAHALAEASGAEQQAMIAQAKLIFTWHKTLGVMVFCVAILRILWALTQPKPGLINGDNRVEALLAEIVHWLLYGSMVLVPLSGWVHHAATTGFAPIWWPFGQGLPFVPKSEYLSHIASGVHDMGKNVLGLAILLHIAGALKHHFVDKDATLRRMGIKAEAAPGSAIQPGHTLPAAIAAAILAITFGGAALVPVLVPISGQSVSGQSDGSTETQIDSGSAAQPQDQSNAATNADGPIGEAWAPTDGKLAIAITQMGSVVEGGFSQWSADIHYSPGEDGKRGEVTVLIPLESLTLGSVKDQAMGADYFDIATYPEARLVADLVQKAGQLTAQGTLEIKGESVPVAFPVALDVNGDTARASGALKVDRRDFGIGNGVSDEASLGFEVQINFELSAQKE